MSAAQTTTAMRRRNMRLAEEARSRKRIRTLVTPEGAALDLRIASASERAGAFLIDFAIIAIGLFVFLLGVGLAASRMGFEGWQLVRAVAMVTVFIVRTFYFAFFEVGRKAATPGKRALGLRVAARDGGRLRADAVLARNFMRELEFLLPLTLLLSPVLNGVEAWIRLLALAWCGVFLFFPFFNRDKLRVGDLIAGTIVVHAPKVKLLSDIVSAAPAVGQDPRFVFTDQQVDAYGIHELHVLEDVLRQSTSEIKKSVADRIRAKIEWTRGQGETDLAFLEAYYGALRKRLEQRMLFGQRKADKFDTGPGKA